MKTRKFIGTALAAAMTVSGAIGVSAANADYSFNAGREKGSQYAVSDERTDMENYSFRLGGKSSDSEATDKTEYSFRKGADRERINPELQDAEAKLEAGEITQEEFDAIKAAAKTKHEQLSSRFDGMSELTPAERHQRFADSADESEAESDNSADEV